MTDGASTNVISLHLELFVIGNPVAFQIFLSHQEDLSPTHGSLKLVTYRHMSVVHAGYVCVFISDIFCHY